MKSYVVTFESCDGDTCEVDQPARSAVDAVRAVHSGYGHFIGRRSGSNAVHYQTTTAHGVITYRVRGSRITEV